MLLDHMKTGFLARLAPAMILAVAFLFASLPERAEAAAQTLEFITSSGAHKFKVEVAETPEARAKGLMFRKSMPRDHGMLFDFATDTTVMMWMKNTYLPLDMVFVSRQGVVTHIAPDAVPMSEAIISSNGPVHAVIELNAGVAREIGLAPGDKVRHGAFQP